MSRLAYKVIILLILFITSCDDSKNNQNIEAKRFPDSVSRAKNQTIFNEIVKVKDPLKSDAKLNTDATNKQNKEIRKPPARYSDFPHDENFNGKPITQQEDMPKEILEKHPDTLSKIALARYRTFDIFSQFQSQITMKKEYQLNAFVIRTN